MSAADKPSPAGSAIGRRRSQARSRPSEAYLRRRRELEAAAIQVMRRKGFRDMTLADIAEDVGSDRASVYYYVGGKEELLADMVYSALQLRDQELADLATSTAPPADKIRAYMNVLMEEFEQHFPYLYIWIQEDFSRYEGVEQTDLSPLIDQSQARYDILRALVEEGLNSGDFTSDLPVGILTQSIIGVVAWTSRWFEPGKGTEASTLAAGLADLVLGGLMPSQPPQA